MTEYQKGKEGAEDSQSNRQVETHTEYASSGRCGVTGRAQDGSFTSSHQDFHGLADGGQR